MANLLNVFYRLLGNTEYLMLLVLVFFTVALLVGSLVVLIGRRKNPAERLNRLVNKPHKEIPKQTTLIEREQSGMMAKFTKPLSTIIAPSEEATKKSVRLRLIQAGLRSEQAYRNFLAAKVALALLFPLVYLIPTAFYALTPEAAGISVTLMVIGFLVPNVFILHLKQKRQQGITKALPDALDLMVVSVEAGLGLDMAFKRVGDELRPLNRDLSDEFYLTNLEVRAGKSREEAFRNMSLRTEVPEIHNLMTVLTQTSRFGTSVAKALRVHADAMRIKRRQIAEEKAAKSAVKLVFPLILFIFPAMLIVLAGPAAIRIARTLFPVLGG